jgi:hypothetical protein
MESQAWEPSLATEAAQLVPAGAVMVTDPDPPAEGTGPVGGKLKPPLWVMATFGVGQGGADTG